MDRMKTYPLPTQEHIDELRKSGQLASVEKPRALKGNPGTLFEVKLQPSALRNGAMPRPIWLHIHTKSRCRRTSSPRWATPGSAPRTSSPTPNADAISSGSKPA
jgi:hypothetical protein